MFKVRYYIGYLFLPLFWIYIKHFREFDSILMDLEEMTGVVRDEIRYAHFVRIFVADEGFRSVLYFRLGKYSYPIRWIYPPLSSFHLSIDNRKLGGGIHVCHAFSTIIVAKSVGKSFWINQNVTIGARDASGYPTIGDNVYVFTGAIVLGNITIGNNVKIGAGSVVVKSVPDNCVVIGNPARIIRKDGIRTDIPL